MPLNEFVTTDEPLGPARHEKFGDDLRAAAAVLANVGPFEEVFKNNANMIIGRKGSGKTSVIQGYRALSTFGHSYGPVSLNEGHGQKHKRNLKIAVVDWGEFHRMVRNVARRCKETTDFPGGEDFNFPEEISQFWADEIWDLILQSLYGYFKNDPRLRGEIPSIITLFETDADFAFTASDQVKGIETTYEMAQREAIDFLNNRKQKCFVLIDSMENYPVRSPRFSEVIGGFLKCLNDFSSKYKSIKIVFCLPEEHIEFFESKSSNYIKDFAAAQHLNWKPFDLLRMLAERYRIGLKTIKGAVEQDMANGLDDFDFTTRDGIRSFFRMVMEPEITNGLEQPEDSMAYVIRHTQLLPREFIHIFNRAICESKAEIGSWRRITANALKIAVEKEETKLAQHILRPYESVYPRLIAACKAVLPELSPVCSKSDLDKLSSRFSRDLEENIHDPWRTLFDIGILGYVDDSAKTQHLPDSDRYVYGFFKYNSDSPIAFNNSQRYCIHPLFSRLWSMKRQTDGENRCVYPAAIDHVSLKE